MEEIIKNMKDRLTRKQRLITLLTSICTALIIIIISILFCVRNIYNDYNAMALYYDTLKENTSNTISNLYLELSDKDNKINQLKEIIDSQDRELQNISEINKSYVDEINYLRSRKELYNKYEYAIYDEMGERTYLTYEEIKLGEDLMLEKGYDPNLLFGTIMVESRGNPNVVNEETGATGYGQFMDETAEFVWNDLMGNYDYYPEIRKDGESNIKMMANYYDYLYKTEGNTFSVIKRYSGNATNYGTLNYINKINSFTNKVGVSIY